MDGSGLSIEDLRQDVALPILNGHTMGAAQQVVVIDAESAEAATQEVLKAHSIPSPVSKDLQALLPAKAEDGAALEAAPSILRQNVLAGSVVASPSGEAVASPVADQGVVAGSPALLQKPTSDLIGSRAAS